jgi:hypothetical protein
VVVHVRHRVVLLALLVFGPVLVCVDEGRVIVLVLVVMRAVLELAAQAANVVMRHVPVIVGMDLGLVLMLMFLVADDLLARRRVYCHDHLLPRVLPGGRSTFRA